jgi:hypothetical protein
MDVTIYLEPYRQTFTLPRDFITTTLAGSIFADALEGDPEATVIPIPNPLVTPPVMQFLVDYSQDKEPVKHIPDLIEASRYLNIPWMMYYVDPLYDYITDKVNWMSPRNQEVLRKAIQEDRVWIVGYYLNKGVKPTRENFVEAIQAQARDVFLLLLSYAADLTDIDLENFLLLSTQQGFKLGVDMLLSKGVPMTMAMLNDAVERGRVDILDALLKRVQEYGGAAHYVGGLMSSSEDVIRRLIVNAASHGQLQSLDYLLTHTDIPPSFEDNVALYETLDNSPENVVEIATRLISDPRFVPDLGLEDLLVGAANQNLTSILVMLLQDPRTHLSRGLLNRVIMPVQETTNNRESLELLEAAERQLPKLPRRR